jgi:S1-C subfamily serine protease
MKGAALLALAVAAALAGGAAVTGSGKPMVVAVQLTPAAGPPDIATGVATGPGRVLTVAHVLDGAGTVSVREPGGRSHRATVARVDRRLDLAMLAVEDLDAPRLRTGPTGGGARLLLLRGDGVDSVKSAVRRHIVAHLVDQPGSPRRPALELAADIRHGDSGAPVLGADGRLAGVVYARSEGRPGTAYAVACAGGGCD